MEVMVATRPPSNHIRGADKGRRWWHNIRRLAGFGGYAAKARERVAGPGTTKGEGAIRKAHTRGLSSSR
jgi:hypothetical protein